MKAIARLSLVVVLFVVLAGCLGGGGDAPARERGDFSDPAKDRIGWENGYWYDESITVDQSDGLNDSEREVWLARSMARVEELRQLEFKRPVTVEVISRTDHQNRSANQEGQGESKNRWNDQVWESLFISEEGKPIEAEFNTVSGSAVLGYYRTGSDTIVIVSDTPDQLVVSNTTFIHELTHALQDQHFDLKKLQRNAKTQDLQLAYNGLIEGEANYIEALYSNRCASAEWACVTTPATQSGGGNSDVNLGILVTIFQPYSDGPWFIHKQVEAGGWDAVNDLWKNPPTSSSEIIHVDPSVAPASVTVEDRAKNGWETFDEGSDTVGEASIFTMFWYQGRQYNISAIDTSSFGEKSGDFDTYDYRSPASTGWVGDAVLPYQKGGEYGYVWTTKWASENDASEFLSTYQTVLQGHGAEEVRSGVWVIREGGFADAFRIERDGTSVTVVNAPTVGDLSDLRP
ncbi:Hvo_1808 family surface protein [Haloarchaeobius sp. DFWS5]|uniref:Hvo_1808 family surface protein n=1 Tax=Haloarchaeobius sp. DFWS5 TaxID=3446114 RepID=UPI003EB9F6F7